MCLQVSIAYNWLIYIEKTTPKRFNIVLSAADMPQQCQQAAAHGMAPPHVMFGGKVYTDSVNEQKGNTAPITEDSFGGCIKRLHRGYLVSSCSLPTVSEHIHALPVLHHAETIGLVLVRGWCQAKKNN